MLSCDLPGPRLEWGPLGASRGASLRTIGRKMGRAYMTTLYGFLDETGDKKQDDRIFMCGYIGWDAAWNKFSPCWGHELRIAGVSAIHATELLSQSQRFSGWSEDKADDLVGRLIDIIRTSVPVGVGVGFDAKHYRTLTNGQRNEIGQPQLILMSRAIKVMASVVEEARNQGDQVEGINITFDDSQDAAQMLRTWLRLKQDSDHKMLRALVPSVGFADDGFFYPLQAADLLANLTNRYWQRIPSNDRAEKHFRNLLTPPQGENVFAYRVGFVTAAEMDEAVRLHKRLY
jgi:Protein of unknown function (DUF3800)